MQADEDYFKKLTTRYIRLTVISLFTLALLQGLHSFFLTLFFWISAGFGALALNYYIAGKRVTQSQHEGQWSGSPDASTGKRSPFLVFAIIGISAMILFAVIGSMISSRKSTDNNSSEASKTEEPEQQQAEKTLSVYDLAAQEFNNKNYRQSISMSRKALLEDSGNKDFMLLLGDDYGLLKQLDSSFIWFDKAYQQGARSAYLSHWLGYLYDEKGSTSKAIEFYKDAVGQDSTRTPAYDRLAELDPDRAEWYKKKSRQWAQK